MNRPSPLSSIKPRTEAQLKDEEVHALLVNLVHALATAATRQEQDNTSTECSPGEAIITMLPSIHKPVRKRRPNKAKLIQAAEIATGRPATSITEFPDGSVKVEIGEISEQPENVTPLDDWRAKRGR